MKQKNRKRTFVIIFIFYSNYIHCLTANKSNDINATTYLAKAQNFIKDKKIDKAITVYISLLKALLEKRKSAGKTVYLDAINYCKKLLQIAPHDYRGYFYWAIALTHLNKKKEAITTYVKAIKLNPKSSTAWHNTALLLRQIEHTKESLFFYKNAISLSPDNENFHFGIAQAYLALGDFEHGWHHMKLGRKSFLQRLKNKITSPEQIKDKTILIPKSWGYGDVIQFARYAKLIKEHGGNVMMHVHEPVAKIISTCRDIDKVTTKHPNPDEYDAQISLWSLPNILGFSETSIAKDVPYIHADPQLSYYWGKRLENDKNFKIAICWSGSGASKNIKDIPLKAFEPLAQIPGITLYSIQKGKQEELAQINFNIIDFSDELDVQSGPFMDTAALMKNVDLVITVDTSIAHLAGALGIPVWTYIIFAPDWRWMLKRTDTPWYPTMKLFRGEKPYDYEYVIKNMKTELEKMVNKS